nr:MAG TPA: hypothetical protein [Caudoviricetes sp.]
MCLYFYYIKDRPDNYFPFSVLTDGFIVYGNVCLINTGDIK